MSAQGSAPDAPTLGECIDAIGGLRGWYAAVPGLYALTDYPTRPIPRLDLPPLRFTDGPKGVALGRSTCFPVSMARGASWDVELEREIGRAMGREAAAQGANTLGSTCINLVRHPGWGRSQESFGCDPVHVGAMGVALMSGIQDVGVLAVIKHFAGNSIENSRFRVDVRIDERALHELYLPHFRACAEAGAAGFMSAYNRLNGRFCGHNPSLLVDVLKGRWRFPGFVMSDFILGVRGTGALASGVDVEMPRRFWFGPARVRRAIDRGKLDEARVRDAANRVIGQLRRFGLTTKQPAPRFDKAVIACESHRQLALESARRSIVLLRNESATLPINNARRIAVIGRLARTPNLGSPGSAGVTPPSTSTLLDGLRDCLPGAVLQFDRGVNPRRAARIARDCDAVIIAAGLGGREEGEYFPLLAGGDRARLELPARQIEVIEAVCAANPRCAVVLYGGSAIACGDWAHRVPALVMAFYPGMAGGRALAEILVGKVNPSGRLPISFPRRTEDCPPFEPAAREVVYDLFHDYRWFDKQAISPAFPFGHGLSFTVFRYDQIALESNADRARVTVGISNTGARDGVEVAQLYLSRPRIDGVEHPRRELKAFRRVEIKAGSTVEVTFELGREQLAWFDPEQRDWRVDAGEYQVLVGPNAASQPLIAKWVVSAPTQ